MGSGGRLPTPTVSRLAEEGPELSELDLNPVIALAPGHGCRIVDARIKVAD